jgi:hypothetical protein
MVELLFNEYRFSILQDGRVIKMPGNTVCIILKPLTFILKMVKVLNFHVICILL